MGGGYTFRGAEGAAYAAEKKREGNERELRQLFRFSNQLTTRPAPLPSFSLPSSSFYIRRRPMSSDSACTQIRTSGSSCDAAAAVEESIESIDQSTTTTATTTTTDFAFAAPLVRSLLVFLVTIFGHATKTWCIDIMPSIGSVEMDQSGTISRKMGHEFTDDVGISKQAEGKPRNSFFSLSSSLNQNHKTRSSPPSPRPPSRRRPPRGSRDGSRPRRKPLARPSRRRPPLPRPRRTRRRQRRPQLTPPTPQRQQRHLLLLLLSLPSVRRFPAAGARARGRRPERGPSPG